MHIDKLGCKCVEKENCPRKLLTLLFFLFRFFFHYCFGLFCFSLSICALLQRSHQKDFSEGEMTKTIFKSVMYFIKLKTLEGNFYSIKIQLEPALSFDSKYIKERNSN